MTEMPKLECPACGQLRAVAKVAGEAETWKFRKHNGADPAIACPGSRQTITLTEAAQRLTADTAADTDINTPPGTDNTTAIGTELDGHQTPASYPELPPEVFSALTVYGDSAGFQVRPAHCSLDSTVLAVLPHDEVTRDGDVMFFDIQTMRYLRDLLNIATARGIL